MKPIDDSRLMNRLIANKLIQNLFSYLSTSNLLALSATAFRLLSTLARPLMTSHFLSPTVQGELFHQPRR